MAISYSGLRSYGKATLPSVSNWGTNTNIARDPPKSIHTRRRDKVGDNLDLTAMLEEAPDRICEAIQVYARGVNPSVSVSYTNAGNNGGGSGTLASGGGRSAKLPYRVMQDGVFRPPILRQENLLPLSRMPREVTSAFTQPGFADFSRKLMCPKPAEKTVEVRNSILKQCVRPTAVYKLEKPIENFKIDNAIQENIVHVTANSGIRTMDRTNQQVKIPVKNVFTHVTHANAKSNISDNRRYVNNDKVETGRYLQEVRTSNVKSNISNSRSYVNNDKVETGRYLQEVRTSNVNTNLTSKRNNTSSIEDIFDGGSINTQNTLHTNYTTPISGIERNNYVHKDIQLERRMPIHSATTNHGKNIYKGISNENKIVLEKNTPLTSYSTNTIARGNVNISSRDKQLKPTLSHGGYAVAGHRPKQHNSKHQGGMTLDPHKSLMSKLVSQSMQSRFN